MRESSLSRITKTVLIQASPAIVYEALTEAPELERWFCDKATSDPRPGGELTAYWRQGKVGRSGRAVYARIDPGSLIEVRWVDEGTFDLPPHASHLIRYTIEVRKGTSRLIMDDEESPPPEDEILAAREEGWNYTLRDLKDHCERRQRSAYSRSARRQRNA